MHSWSHACLSANVAKILYNSRGKEGRRRGKDGITCIK